MSPVNFGAGPSFRRGGGWETFAGDGLGLRRNTKPGRTILPASCNWLLSDLLCQPEVLLPKKNKKDLTRERPDTAAFAVTTKPLVTPAGTEGRSRELRLSGCCQTDALTAEINFYSTWHADGQAHATAWLARASALENLSQELTLSAFCYA